MAENDVNIYMNEFPALQAPELHPVGQDEGRHVRVLHWRMEVRPFTRTRPRAILCRHHSYIVKNTATFVIG